MTEQKEPKINPFGIASLVCGVVGLIIWVIAILGVVFGHVARNQIKKTPQKYSWGGLALAGLIVSYIIVAINMLALLGMGAFWVSILSS